CRRAGVGFYEIEEVRFFTRHEEATAREDGVWWPDDRRKVASIKLCRRADVEGLTHEVGHSLFHPSPLHDRHNEDPKYGDKFCNALRYVVDPAKGMEWMAADGEQYDAHKLVERCPDLETFGNYFVELCQRKRQSMNRRILDGEGI